MASETTSPIIDPVTLSEEQRDTISAMYSTEKQLEFSGETENEKTVGRSICMTLDGFSAIIILTKKNNNGCSDTGYLSLNSYRGAEEDNQSNVSSL